MQQRLYARARAINIWLMAPLLGLAVFLSVFVAVSAPVAQAATSSNLNFQARLLTSSGAIVPDGTYNIDFKLYNADSTTGTVGTCTGACLWEETRKNFNSQGVTVINGYFSVNLGSVTAFGGSINWDQQLWLTMNIGGTSVGASPTWDGEMQNAGHSIALTALPYAFVAAQLAKTDGSGNRGTLSFGSVTNNPAIQLPNESGTVCTTAASGVCNTAGGLSNVAYLNQTQTFTGTNTFQPSTNVSSLVVKQTTVASPTADIFDVQTVNATKVIQVTTTATDNASLRLSSVGSGSTVLLQGDDEKISFSGTESRILIDTTGSGISNFIDFFRNSNTTSSRRLRVFKGDNTATETFGIDASNGNILMGNNLDLESAGSLTIGGSTATTVTLGSTTASSGSQTFNIGNNATAGTYASTVSIGSTLNASVTTIKGGSGGVNLSPSGASNSGVLIKPGSDSTGALQVQKASGSNVVMGVDTTNNQLILGTAGASGLNGKLVFSTTNASNTTITIQAASTATSYSLTLPTTGPALGQCLQNDGSTIGQLTFGACGASGTFLNKNATDTSSAAGGSGYLYGFTSSGSSTGGVLSLNNSTNTGNALNVTTAGNPASGKAVIYGENTNASPTGNLIDLRSGSTPTSKFSVDASGNVLFGGTLNTNTFTSTSLQFAGAGSASIQSASSQALNITGNATSLWQVGGTNQNLTIQTSGTGILALDTVGLGTVNLGAANAGTINIGNNNSTAITIGGTSVLGTVTNKVTGLTTTLTGAASNSSYVVKSTSNSTGTFQVQNSGSNKVFSVDTTAGQTVLGQSNSVNGSLLFQNNGNTNGITLNATGGSSAYTLTLPTAAPAGGLCIETQPGNASQLIFASCTNNNASIQEVAYWDANGTNTIPSVTPTTIGDEMVLTTQIPNAGMTVTGVAGGGVPVGGWSKVVANNGNGTVNRVEMWVGTVASLTTSSITVTYSGSVSGEEVTTTEFTAAGVNASTSWGIESSNSQLNSTASATVTFPSATAVNGSELYVGYAQVSSPPATTGSTTGFSYIQTNTQHNMITYNTSLAANTTYQPTASQTYPPGTGQSNTVEAVLTAFVTSSSINNTTSLQKANFYVQAASAGTVAGVLQAASSGSADVLDLRNSGGTNVVTVSSAGNVLVKPAASTTAFQVQNGSGYSVMAVDTSGNSVVVGDATHLSGSITFKDSSDSNTISITAPTSVATNYTLALPNNAPTAGLCLATSPSNANQLVFSSCATQVSAATISYVGKWDNTGSGVTSISTVSPTSVGDLMVFYSHTGSGGTINTISGGGVPSGGWTKVTAYTGAGTPGNIEMWRGVVATAGASAVNVTYTGTAGTNEIVAEEFTMGSANGTWAIDTSGTATSTSSVTTVNYPTLTPLNSNELYAGYAYGGSTMSGTCGTTSGFTYVVTGNNKCLTYKTNVTGGTPYTPTATQSPGGVYASVAAIIEAYVGTSVIVNTTATQQANFNVQASVSGSVAGVLQGASSGSADVLQVKDGSGINVMTVNTSNVNGVDGVTLGASNSVSGQLTFNSSGNSNSITIAAPSAPGASYILTLPTTTPAPGQCLATSPSNANQLVFSSCANQVTSVAITFVNNWKASQTTLSPSLPVSPVNLGDLVTFEIFASKGNTISNVAGGGVSAWSRIVTTGSFEMWRGQVTSTGSVPNITANLSTPSGPTVELAAQEWTTGSNNGSWVVDTSGSISNSSNTTVNYPNLTPQSSKDLYVGYAIGSSTMSAGSTSGYSYLTGGATSNMGAYNTTVSAASQPTATQSSAGTSNAIGALIAAYSSSSVIANSTNTQQANFNIQAATSGSVAGTLQAFFTGTGDILDLLDGSGTLTDKFDYQGNLLVRPSTAGATAFQVQNTSNVNVLSVDTSGKQVVIGAGSTGESSVSLLVLDKQTGSSGDPTAVIGAMYYNGTTHTFRCAVESTSGSAVWQNCSGLIYSNISTSTVSNCSNNCASFSTAATVPANSCQPGRVINLHASGYYSSLGSAGNLQFGVYYGGDPTVASNDVLVGSLPPTVSVISASNYYFQLDFTVNCYSTSSMQAEGLLSIQLGAAGSGLTTVPLNSTGGTTVSTSTDKSLYIFPIWGTASTSNTATITQFNVTSP